MTDPRLDNSRRIKARTGPSFVAKHWTTEAAVRMLMNNLDDEVAENPQSLVVYGGIGRAARNWACYDKIVEVLERLEQDETLLVQSGKPVGVFPTHKDAPRVLIANSNLVPKWATWEKFNELDRAGPDDVRPDDRGQLDLHRHPGHRPGHLRDLRRNGPPALWRRLERQMDPHRGPRRHGRARSRSPRSWPARIASPSRCQESSIQKRLETRYLDHRADSIDEALEIIRAATEPVSVGVLGNAAEILPDMVARGIRPDAVTDQTSAHDPANGYCPAGWSVAKWIEMRERDPSRGGRGRAPFDGRHVEAMLAFQKMGVPTFDYGNNIRQEAFDDGVLDAFDFPGFVPGLCPALVLPRDRPVPLGGSVGRSGGYLPHRPAGEGADPRRSSPPPLARHGARSDRLSGAARADLLGRTRPAPPPWPGLQRDGQEWRGFRPDRHRPRPSRQRQRRRPIAKPKR